MFCIKEKFKQMIPAAKCQLNGFITSNACPVYPRQPIDPLTRAKTNFSRHRSFAESSLKASSREQEIVIALGGNVGDRISNFNSALQLMKDSGISILRHAWLYEVCLHMSPIDHHSSTLLSEGQQNSGLMTYSDYSKKLRRIWAEQMG